MLDSANLVAFHLSHGGSAVVVEEKPLLGAGVKVIAVDGTPPIVVTHYELRASSLEAAQAHKELGS